MGQDKTRRSKEIQHRVPGLAPADCAREADEGAEIDEGAGPEIAGREGEVGAYGEDLGGCGRGEGGGMVIIAHCVGMCWDGRKIDCLVVHGLWRFGCDRDVKYLCTLCYVPM